MPYFTRQVAPNGGLILKVLIGVSRPRRDALLTAHQLVPPPISVDALLDTGASCSCVDLSVLAKLNLSPTGQAAMLTPSTGAQPSQADQYDVSLAIIASKNQAPLIHQAVPVVATDLQSQGFEALLGRDVLGGCLLTYDGLNGLFSLAY